MNDNSAGAADPSDTAARSRIQRLIAGSSLGTPGARSLQGRAPVDKVDEIMRMVARLDVRNDPAATAVKLRAGGGTGEPAVPQEQPCAFVGDTFESYLHVLRRKNSHRCAKNEVVAWRSFGHVYGSALADSCHLTVLDGQHRLNAVHRILAFVSSDSVTWRCPAPKVDSVRAYEQGGAARAKAKWTRSVWAELVDSSIALAEFDVTYTGGGAAAARMRDSWTTLWSLLSLMAVGDSCAARPIVIMDDTSVLENRCNLSGHSLTGRQKLDGVLLTDEAVVAGGFLEAAMDAIGDYANAFEQEREDGPVVADLRSVAQAFADALPDSVREKPEAVIIAGDPRGAAPLLRFEGQATGRIHRKGPLADGPLGAVAVIDPPEAGRDSGRH